MYVRDHCRPAFHKAVGVAPHDYDFQVFRLCSEISKQTFPLTLDLDHPAFKPGLDRFVDISREIERADAEGGLLGKIRRGLAIGKAALTFARLYLIPAKPNPLPENIRLEPVW
jgi:magnesium-protoporphyrin IX monomethyl ester (oxidative) cyclase